MTLAVQRPPGEGHLGRCASQFGRAVASAAVSAIAAPAIVRGRNLNEKLNIAIIGVGGRGGDNLRRVASENIVALCDVFEPSLGRAAVNYPQARRYGDFRKLYDNAREFDAVVVSTTEHTHAFATLPALQLGKHVYCEKPLTHNIWEARVIREAAAKAKVATQMGTQIHAGDNYRRVVELIQTGAIGPVREVHVWVGRAWGRQSKEAAERHHDIVVTTERPASTSPLPTGSGLGLVARAGARAAVSRGLFSRAQMVPLVGFRQRHHERSGQPLERPAVLGAQAASRR